PLACSSLDGLVDRVPGGRSVAGGVAAWAARRSGRRVAASAGCGRAAAATAGRGDQPAAGVRGVVCVDVVARVLAADGLTTSGEPADLRLRARRRHASPTRAAASAPGSPP